MISLSLYVAPSMVIMRLKSRETSRGITLILSWDNLNIYLLRHKVTLCNLWQQLDFRVSVNRYLYGHHMICCSICLFGIVRRRQSRKEQQCYCLIQVTHIIKMLPAVERGTPKCHPKGTMLPEASSLCSWGVTFQCTSLDKGKTIFYIAYIHIT